MVSVDMTRWVRMERVRQSASSELRASVRVAMSSSVPTEGWEMDVGIGRFFREAIEFMTA